MNSTYTDPCAENRVEGDTVAATGQTVEPAPPELGESLGGATTAPCSPREVRESSSAVQIADDGISPDDAPEVMLDEDDDGEVRAFTYTGLTKCHY
jgi:hypothetical protein